MIYFALTVLVLRTVGISYELFSIKEDSIGKVIGQVLGKMTMVTAYVYILLQFISIK